MNSNNPTQSYLENYKILKEIAEKMRQSEDLDIDQLIPLVEKATQAYQQCQARINAVEQALQHTEKLD